MAKFKRVTALMMDAADQEALLKTMTEALDTPVSEIVAKVNSSLKKDI